MKTILIVEDEQSIASALDVLCQQAGYQTRLAHTGADALRLLFEQPDLLILDIMLPDMDGYEVCRQVRMLPTYIPVLMLTAKDTVLDKVKGLETGADAYLTKPLEPAELLAQIRAIFRFGKQQREGVLTCGPLTLLEDAHRVTLDNAELHLTSTEYQLLHLFMQEPGRVFGREMLLRKVWGYDFGDNTRTVDVHMQRLRAKVEANPKEPKLLQTVRGFGYRLVQP